MIAALESNSRNYSNWIELDKIFTSRLRRVFARGAKCKDDASLFVENHRVKLSVVPPSPIPSFDVSFFYPPLSLRSCAFVPILATGTFISTRPLQPTNAYLAYTDSSLRTWKRLHYQPCLCSYSCHSLLSWFPLRFHPEYASLSSDLSLYVLVIYRWKEEQEWPFSWSHVYLSIVSLYITVKSFSRIFEIASGKKL